MNNAIIETANSHVASLMGGLRSAVDLAIVDNVPHSLRTFFLSGIDSWTLEVLHDQDDQNKNDDLMCAKIPHGVYSKHIKTSADLVAFYMHSMAHVMCKFLWTHVPDGTVTREFSTHEINLMEEIYNQVMMYHICPLAYRNSIKLFTMYDTITGRDKFKEIELMRSLLTTQVDPDLDIKLQMIHEWIWHKNVFQQTVFDGYIKAWETLLLDPSINSQVEQFAA